MQTLTRERETTKGPARTCVGCGRHDLPDALVRFVLGPARDDGAHEVAADVLGSPGRAGGNLARGRGAHVHARSECITKACRGGLARAFRCKVHAIPEEISAQIIEGCDRRIAGLLLGARRSGALAIGADATADVLTDGARVGSGEQKEDGEGPLVVVASDAGTVTSRGPIASAIGAGRAIAWKTKSVLGELLGRQEVAVCVVTDPAIARALREARTRSASIAGGGVP